MSTNENIRLDKSSNDRSTLENFTEVSQVELSVEELERISGGAHTIEHSGDPVPPPVIHRDVTH